MAADEKRFMVKTTLEVIDKSTGSLFMVNENRWGDMGLADVQGVEVAYLGMGQVLLEQSFKDTDGKPDFVADGKKS